MRNGVLTAVPRSARQRSEWYCRIRLRRMSLRLPSSHIDRFCPAIDGSPLRSQPSWLLRSAPPSDPGARVLRAFRRYRGAGPPVRLPSSLIDNKTPGYRGFVVQRSTGVEPASRAWEARVIPLYDDRNMNMGAASARVVQGNRRSSRAPLRASARCTTIAM